MALQFISGLVPVTILTYGTVTKFSAGYLGNNPQITIKNISDPLLLQFFDEMVLKLNISNPVSLLSSKEISVMFSSIGHEKERMPCKVLMHPKAFTTYTTDEIKYFVTRELIKISESDHATWDFLPEGVGLLGLFAGCLVGGAVSGCVTALTLRYALGPIGSGTREGLIDRMALRILPPRIGRTSASALTKLKSQVSRKQQLELTGRIIQVKSLTAYMLEVKEV